MNTLKNILLVYPEVPGNTYWSFRYALSFVGKKSAMPPLGLITIAALIPDQYQIKLVDMNIEPLQEKDVKWADAVLVSAMIVQHESFGRVVEICNRLNTTVVAGGPYPSSNHEELSGVDHFVIGEAEDTFLGFLEDLHHGTARKIYFPKEFPDITHTVIPRFDLLNIKAYGSMSIQYSRGCPFHCEFCDIWKMLGNKPRLKSAENVIAELDQLFKIGWRGNVFVVDDNFIGNTRRVKKELLPVLIDWQKSHKYIYQFYTEASINLSSDAELMAAMRESGFSQVFIGIETPSDASLKETGKIQNLKTDLKTAVSIIQQNGIEVMGGFILGFDSDTGDIFDQQIDFIQQTGIAKAMVGLLNAVPGTELYKRLDKEGRILGKCMGNNTSSTTTNFKTRMGRQMLREGYRKVLSAIYDSNLKNYFTRCNRLLDRLEHIDHFQRKIYFNDIKAFFKSIFRQPFTPYGFQYVKFVFRNLFRNRKIFGEAIVYAIEGHHFHTITQQTLKADRIALALDETYQHFRSQLEKYSEAIYTNSKEACESIVNLWEDRQQTLGDIRQRIDAIHTDFRGDVIAKYTDISQQIKELFKGFEGDLKQFGIAFEI